MKILLDTNIIFSTFVLNSSFLKNLLDLCIQKNHKLFIDDYCMNELNSVLDKKQVDIKNSIEIINSIMNLPLINFLITSKENWNLQKVRDIKDIRVISSALANKMDILLTGDKDLLSLKQMKVCITNPTTLMGLI